VNSTGTVVAPAAESNAASNAISTVAAQDHIAGVTFPLAPQLQTPASNNPVDPPSTDLIGFAQNQLTSMPGEVLKSYGFTEDDRAKMTTFLGDLGAQLNAILNGTPTVWLKTEPLATGATIGPMPKESRIELRAQSGSEIEAWNKRNEDALTDPVDRLAVAIANQSGTTDPSKLNAIASTVEMAFKALGSAQTILRPGENVDETSREATIRGTMLETFPHGVDDTLERDQNQGGIDQARKRFEESRELFQENWRP
jgi:hypothetical protein